MSGHTCWATAKKRFVACKNEKRSYWKEAIFRGTAAANDAVAVLLGHHAGPRCLQRPPLSSASIYMCNSDLCNPKGKGPAALCQSVLWLPLLTSSLPKQQTLTTNIKIKQTLAKYTYSVVHSLLIQEEPLGHPVLFWHSVLPWLISSSIVSCW